MGIITIGRHEDVLEIRNKILHELKTVKVLSAKKYSGRLKLKEDPMFYQKRVRREWNEHTD